MSVNTASSSLDDLRTMLELVRTGKRPDSELEKRILERSAVVRQRLPHTEIAVELVRDARDQ